jgi:hypothetical protein
MGMRMRRAAGRPLMLAAAVAAVAAAGAGEAAAGCTNGGGRDCLPGTGYTGQSAWACGAIPVLTNCYATGVTNPSGGVLRRWGWASAAYGGSGTVYVCVYGGSHFFACGDNLARGCFLDRCDAQRSTDLKVWFDHAGSGTHTVTGSAMW